MDGISLIRFIMVLTSKVIFSLRHWHVRILLSRHMKLFEKNLIMLICLTLTVSMFYSIFILVCVRACVCI